METRRLVDVQTRGRESPGSQTAKVIQIQSRKRWYRIWLFFMWLVMALLLYLAIRQTPFEEITEVIGRLQPGSILALVVVNLGFLVLANLRWMVLLRSFGFNVPLVSLMAYRLAGFGLSYVTPGPQFGGEPLQVYLLHHRSNVPLDSAISSVFLERIVDLIANFTFLFVGSIVIVSSGLFLNWINGWSWFLALCLLSLPTGHYIGLQKGKLPASWLLKNFTWSWFRETRNVIIRSEEQVSELIRTRPATMVWLAGLSVLVWCGAIYEFWLCLHFLGVNAGWVETISALTAARLALLVPVPGGLGALETSQFLAAGMLGWGSATGLAVSLVIRSRDVILAVIGLLIGITSNRKIFSKVDINDPRRKDAK